MKQTVAMMLCLIFCVFCAACGKTDYYMPENWDPSTAYLGKTEEPEPPLPATQKGPLKGKYVNIFNETQLNEYLDIYIPTEVGFCNMQFRHSVSTASNFDIWRIYKMTAADDEGNKRYDITNTGEFEAAIRLEGRKDFSGGAQHGDEIVKSLQCFVDGVLTDIGSLAEMRSFEELKILRDSVLYDPADHTTEIAQHAVEYVFCSSGVTVKQEITWLTDAVCSTSYTAMFPVLRTAVNAAGETVPVSEFYTDDKSPEMHDVRQAGQAEYPQIWKDGVRKMILKSETLGLEASLEIAECTEVPGAGYTQCSPAEQYNKLYFSITGFGDGERYAAKKGETWETTAHYTVKIEK